MLKKAPTTKPRKPETAKADSSNPLTPLEATFKDRFGTMNVTMAATTWAVNQFIEELHAISLTEGGVRSLQALSRWAEDMAQESSSKLGGDKRFPGTDEEQAILFRGLAQCLMAYATPETV